MLASFLCRIVQIPILSPGQPLHILKGENLKRLALIVLLLSLTACATAQTSANPNRRPEVASVSDVTAEDLVSYCRHLDDSTETDQGVVEKQACTMYIRGFLDGFTSGMEYAYGKKSGFCLPVGSTFGQYGKVIAKYGKDHPEELWVQAHLFTYKVLTNAYPCTAK